MSAPTNANALQKRTLRVLTGAQLLSGAGLAAGITVGALLAEDMIGSKGSTGLPTALFTIGSAAAALVIGMLSQRSGRRLGLAAGYLVGALGGGGVVAAAAVDSVALLLVSLFFYGAGTATSLQARYAGADLAPADRRGRAVSVVLVATTLGAVVGPNLVEVTGEWASAIDIPELAGPFMLATAAYALAAVAIWLLLRPDPLLVARRIKASQASTAAGSEDSAREETGSVAGIRVAVAVMVITQIVMIAVMTMTPIHMRDHDHSLSATGLVISLHVAAMFLPSPLTGIAVDRFGRRPLIAASGVVLLAAGILAAVVPPESTPLLALALILLGLGWNFGLVSGTALITDSAPLAERAKTQGRADLLIALSGAAGGLGSGFVVAGTSYATLALIGGAMSLLMVPLLFAVPRERATAP